MSVVVIEQAGTSLLTTLARVQGELGLAAGTDDDLLIAMIDRASSAIARETRRVFGVETVTETLDGPGSRLLGLTRTPVVEVTEVTEDGTPITDYSVEDAEAGALYRANGWGRSGGLRMWGTESYASGYILPGYRDQRYSVTYRAGYVLPPETNPFLQAGPTDPQNLPGAVEQACLETVRAWYGHAKVSAASTTAGASGPLRRVRIGPVEAEYGAASTSAVGATLSSESLPPAALGLLRNYYQGYGR